MPRAFSLPLSSSSSITLTSLRLATRSLAVYLATTALSTSFTAGMTSTDSKLEPTSLYME